MHIVVIIIGFGNEAKARREREQYLQADLGKSTLISFALKHQLPIAFLYITR